LQQPAALVPFIWGSRSFPDRIAKLELSNEFKQEAEAKICDFLKKSQIWTLGFTNSALALAN